MQLNKWLFIFVFQKGKIKTSKLQFGGKGVTSSANKFPANQHLTHLIGDAKSMFEKKSIIDSNRRNNK